MTGSDISRTPLQEKLDQIAEFERQSRTTPITHLLIRVGRTRAFGRVYKRLGPAIDPWLLRKTKGKLGSRLYGLPTLLVTTTGAKTGQQRVQALVYIRDGDDFVVVGTNFGQTHHPGWTANLLAHPEAVVEVGPATVSVTAELVDSANSANWQRLWPRFVAIYPGYEDYLTRTGGRVPRMFLLHPHA